MSPKITVFIPVYNRQQYIAKTIESVLQQSFKNFQLLLIDDGSTDNSLEIMRSFTDKRITIIENGENLGIPKTRNIGLQYAQGEYLAILDSDDLMLKHRLKRQKKFLDKNLDYVGVGSWSRYIDHKDNVIRWLVMRPISHNKIKASLLFHCAIHNRTFMARTHLLKQFAYKNDYTRCQDYELLYRLSKKHKLHNLPEILVQGRKHDDQITKSTIDIGDNLKKQIASMMLDDLGISYDQNDLTNHIRLVRGNGDEIAMDYIDWCEIWFDKITEANANKNIYDADSLNQVIAKLWMKIFSRSSDNETSLKGRGNLLKLAGKYTQAYFK